MTHHRLLKGRRFTAEEKQHALVLVSAGMEQGRIARIVDTTPESVRRWVREAERQGAMPQPLSGKASNAAAAPADDRVTTGVGDTSSEVAKSGAPDRSLYTPKDPAQGLSDPEVAAILELKRQHPSYGPAQLRAQLKRFKGWRLSNKAIARVLRKNGYELVHRARRPQGPEPIRFEAPHRNALWQMDYTELRVSDDKFSLLVILDDFSRYIVAHEVCDAPCADVALEALRRAIARHGKPEAVRTDRGGAFLSTDFTQALENELIDHLVGRPYHPEGGGKVEAVIGTLRRELWDTEHFADRPQAKCRLAEFFADYNERRAHMGIDGLTPADRFFGRADRVLAEIDALSRKRNGARQLVAPPGAAVEEISSLRSGAPMEVLRFVVVDGQMELRLLGAVVRLGAVQV
jgi:putative transposase